jgi:hypothetical protein
VTEGRTEQVLPTVTGFAARQAIAVLGKHNIAIAPLLRRAGLSEYDFARDVSSPLHRVSAVGQARAFSEKVESEKSGIHKCPRI